MCLDFPFRALSANVLSHGTAYDLCISTSPLRSGPSSSNYSWVNSKTWNLKKLAAVNSHW